MELSTSFTTCGPDEIAVKSIDGVIENIQPPADDNEANSFQKKNCSEDFVNEMSESDKKETVVAVAILEKILSSSSDNNKEKNFGMNFNPPVDFDNEISDKGHHESEVNISDTYSSMSVDDNLQEEIVNNNCETDFEKEMSDSSKYECVVSVENTENSICSTSGSNVSVEKSRDAVQESSDFFKGFSEASQHKTAFLLSAQLQGILTPPKVQNPRKRVEAIFMHPAPTEDLAYFDQNIPSYVDNVNKNEVPTENYEGYVKCIPFSELADSSTNRMAHSYSISPKSSDEKKLNLQFLLDQSDPSISKPNVNWHTPEEQQQPLNLSIKDEKLNYKLENRDERFYESVSPPPSKPSIISDDSPTDNKFSEVTSPSTSTFSNPTSVIQFTTRDQKVFVPPSGLSDEQNIGNESYPNKDSTISSRMFQSEHITHLENITMNASFNSAAEEDIVLSIPEPTTKVSRKRSVSRKETARTNVDSGLFLVPEIPLYRKRPPTALQPYQMQPPNTDRVCMTPERPLQNYLEPLFRTSPSQEEVTFNFPANRGAIFHSPSPMLVPSMNNAMHTSGVPLYSRPGNPHGHNIYLGNCEPRLRGPVHPEFVYHRRNDVPCGNRGFHPALMSDGMNGNHFPVQYSPPNYNMLRQKLGAPILYAPNVMPPLVSPAFRPPYQYPLIDPRMSDRAYLERFGYLATPKGSPQVRKGRRHFQGKPKVEKPKVPPKPRKYTSAEKGKRPAGKSAVKKSTQSPINPSSSGLQMSTGQYSEYLASVQGPANVFNNSAPRRPKQMNETHSKAMSDFIENFFETQEGVNESTVHGVHEVTGYETVPNSMRSEQYQMLAKQDTSMSSQNHGGTSIAPNSRGVELQVFDAREWPYPYDVDIASLIGLMTTNEKLKSVLGIGNQPTVELLNSRADLIIETLKKEFNTNCVVTLQTILQTYFKDKESCDQLVDIIMKLFINRE